MLKLSFRKLLQLLAVFSAGAFTTFVLFAFREKQQQEGYILIHEKDIAVRQAGPHDGGGLTTAYPFFSDVKDFKMAFRKRVLQPGSSIGYHLQETDEVYYILAGSGEMKMNGKTFTVNTGDAVLTRPGNSHGLKPLSDGLTLLIAYQIK